MKECENCIHVDLCSEYYYVGEVCLMYKDKSKFIELPCSIGTTVYVITYDYDEWSTYDSKKIIQASFRLDMLKKLNKTIFLTQEEAKKKLEEMSNEKE